MRSLAVYKRHSHYIGNGGRRRTKDKNSSRILLSFPCIHFKNKINSQEVVGQKVGEILGKRIIWKCCLDPSGSCSWRSGTDCQTVKGKYWEKLVTLFHQTEVYKYSIQVKLDFCIVYNLWNYGLYAPNLLNMGFPGGVNGKEPVCRCRIHKRRQFNPGAKKIPRGGHGNPLQYSSHGQRSLAGYSPQGCKESDTTKGT